MTAGLTVVFFGNDNDHSDVIEEGNSNITISELNGKKEHCIICIFTAMPLSSKILLRERIVSV